MPPQNVCAPYPDYLLHYHLPSWAWQLGWMVQAIVRASSRQLGGWELERVVLSPVENLHANEAGQVQAMAFAPPAAWVMVHAE